MGVAHLIMATKYNPISIPVGPSYGGDRWFCFSPTLLREVAFSNQLKADRWATLEWNSNCSTFCEQPAEASAWLEGAHAKASIHFWVRMSDDSEFLERVLYDDRPLSSGESKKHAACFKWCEVQNKTFRVIKQSDLRKNALLLTNWKYVLGFYDERSYAKKIETVRGAYAAVLALISTASSSMSVQRLLDKIQKDIPLTQARLALFDLLRRGSVTTQLETHLLTGESIVRLNENKKSS